MHPAMEKLYVLQQIDSAILQLRRQIASLDPGNTLEAEANAAAERLRGAEQRLKTLTADLHDAELELKSVEEKIKQFEGRLYSGSVVNPKELSALEKDIESLKKQRGRLDEKVLVLWDEIEAQKEIAAAARAHHEGASQAYQTHHTEYLTRKNELEQQLATHARQRQTAVKEIEPAILQRYDAIRQKLGGVAIAPVKEDVCGACHTAVTAYIMTRLREDPVFITCESCGRLLYLPPEET